MTLPILNEAKFYTTKIPSTNREVNFRPFVIKEQKLLLIALESNDEKQIINSMIKIIEACYEDIDVKKLSTFDLEYLFLQLRSKSVGEIANITMKCKNCNASNKVEVNLEDVKIIKDDKEGELNKKIKLTDDFHIVLRYPSYYFATRIKKSTDNEINMLVSCFDKLLSKDEIINFDDQSEDEIMNFVNSLSIKQYSEIVNNLNSIPTLYKEQEFDCKKCNHHNVTKLEGMKSFFM